MSILAPRSRRTRTSPPESQKPHRAGVLGTILTQLDFGESEREELQDLAWYLSGDLEAIAEVAAGRACQVVLESEGLVEFRILEPLEAPRPSIQRLRRRVAMQWLKSTFHGEYDTYFAKQLRNSWFPMLLAVPFESRPSPVVVAGFLDFMEAFMLGRILDEKAVNFVPAISMAHGLRKALDIQRHLLGIN